MLKQIRKLFRSPITRRRLLVNLGVFASVYWVARIRNQRKQSTQSVFPASIATNSSCFTPSSGIATASAKAMIKLSVDARSLLSDVTPDEQVKNGRRILQYNDRTYAAFYWINNVRWQHPDGSPRLLENVPIPPSQIIHVKKVWIDTTWVQTFDELYLRKEESWYLNKGADVNLIYKTITTAITT